MRTSKLLFVIIFCFLIVYSYGQTNFKKTTINFDGESNTAINDLRNVLKKYNVGTIDISRESLGNRTGQEFFLEIDTEQTEIKYTTQNSLENAVYTFLDMLGFRWYGPGQNWFVKPEIIKLPIFKGKWLKPSFRNRYFFGTGGLDFGTTQPYDPQNQYKTKWEDWKRRNRFNVDFAARGHTGEAFYLENKPLLDAHPEWFNSEIGKIRGRFKIDQPGAINAYKSWVKKKFGSSGELFRSIGVEPEDGRGGADDPMPPPKMGIKNHADKWWWVANEVAKDYSEEDKKIVISAFAYGDGPNNALVPSFPLRNNVYPIIIPYAFQKAYQPEEMVRIWASRIKRTMGIWDYWNITQWSLGLPQLNFYNAVERLHFWKEFKIDGVYLETTEAAGPMGHVLWLAGQLEWDITKNFDKLYLQYLNDCFGNAATQLKIMFDRWALNFQGSGDVALSLGDLNIASSKVDKNSPEWRRINELKAYVHYLKLYYEHDGTQQSKDRIFRYLYSIHHLMMVQTAAFVGQSYIPPFDKGNLVPDAKRLVQLSPPEIEEQFRHDLLSSPVKYNVVNFTFDFSKVKYIEPIPQLAWRFGANPCNFFFQAPFTGIIQLDVGAEGDTKFNFLTKNKIISDNNAGKSNYDYVEELNNRKWWMKKYQLNIEKNEMYYIQTSNGSNRLEVNTPGIVLFKNPGVEDFDTYQYPEQYFYVPQNASEIIFYDLHDEGTLGRGFLVSSTGEVMKRQSFGEKNLYRVPVEPKARGKLWKANFGHPSWALKNIPNIASLQKFQYITE